MQKKTLDGFYAGFFTAEAGEGAAVFVIREGVVVGTDLRAFQYDGTYQMTPVGEAKGKATVKVPPGQQSILGVSGGDAGLSYDVDFVLPVDFLDRPYIQINTTFGPVRMRLVKLRDLSSAGQS